MRWVSVAQVKHREEKRDGREGGRREGNCNLPSVGPDEGEGKIHNPCRLAFKEANKIYAVSFFLFKKKIF